MSGNPPDPNDPNRQGHYPPDPNRQGQYHPDPNRQGQYPPPSQWNIGHPDGHPPPPPTQYPPASHYPYPPTSYPPAPYPPVSYPPPPTYPPASYPPPAIPEHHYQPPPHTQYPAPPAMHPSAHDPYRLPPPPAAYRPPDVYAHPGPGTAPVAYPPAAPRQRTAIACSYCRRRKIRCSGFENSTDGRCSNCIRFNQECLFTPVSSQAQAFVPAHAAYPHLRNPQNRARPGVVLYGAQGQPLPPQHQPPHEGPLPPPQGMYGHAYAQPPPHMNGATPPLAPIHDPRINGRRGSTSGYDYPDPTNLAPVTPATSAPGYPPNGIPYYPPPPQPDRRASPQTPYPYDGRHSSSPHSSPYPPMYAPQGGATPPPNSTPAPASSANSSRGGLNVRDMLNPGDQNQEGRSSADQSQSRTSTDSDMLNALNRRGLNK